MAALKKLIDPFSTLLDVCNKQGIEALSDAERNYANTLEYYYEVMNGGRGSILEIARRTITS